MCCKEDFELTEKQFQFCQEYVTQYCNGTQAYLIVHPKVKYDTACTEASKLLANPKVNACVKKLIAEHNFNKQEIINNVILSLVDIASGKAPEQTHITEKSEKFGMLERYVNGKSTSRDRNQACDILLKLFGAYETTSNVNADEEAEEMKENAKTNITSVEGFNEDNK